MAAGRPVLREYQRRVTARMRPHRRAAWVGPRQVGKDFCAALEAIDMVLATGADATCFNKDQRQSTKFLRVVQGHLDKLDRVGMSIRASRGSATEIPIMVDGGTAYIRALPGIPDSMQGFTGNVILNEVGANRHDPEAVIEQAESLISSDDRFRLRMYTNATRKGTWLHRFIEGVGPGPEARRRLWHIQRTPITTLFPKGLPPRILEMKEAMSTGAWARWMLCEFADSGDGTFPLEHYVDPEFTGRGVRMMAVDIGATRHPSAWVVVEGTAEGWRVVDEELWWRQPLPDQPRKIAEAALRMGVRKVIIDHGGVGKSVHQALEQMLGKDRVVGVSVSNKSRATGAEMILAMMRDRRIAFGEGMTREHLADVVGEPEDAITLPEIQPYGEDLHHCDLADALIMLAPHIQRPGLTMPTAGRAKRLKGRRMHQGM